jgi:Family of unknown function (DUF6460)
LPGGEVALLDNFLFGPASLPASKEERMSEEDRFATKPTPHWPQAQMQEQGHTPAGVLPHPETSALNRFLGGSPGAVFLRLLFVSLIVGAFFMWLDIKPEDIFRGILEIVDRVRRLGFAAVREVANYIFAGAVIVVPIWLVLRLMNMRNGR